MPEIPAIVLLDKKNKKRYNDFMTKILVMSDSHGAQNNINCLFEKNYDYIIFLGDGLKDLGVYTNLNNCFYVKGNCDVFAYDIPLSQTIFISGIKMFITHGHEFCVKHGTEILQKHVENEEYGIVCFGHTHIRFLQFTNETLFINPGAIGNGEYAEIEITKDGKINGKLFTL